jgi:YD repeat-containing protein
MSLVDQGDLSFEISFDGAKQLFAEKQDTTTMVSQSIARGTDPGVPTWGNEDLNGWSLEPVKRLYLHDIETNCSYTSVGCGPSGCTPGYYSYTRSFVRRWQYGGARLTPKGAESTLSYTAVSSDNCLSGGGKDYFDSQIQFPTQYWSDSGQIWLDNAGPFPILHFSDGTVVEFYARGDSNRPTSNIGGGTTYLPTRKIDHNGNVTTYTYATFNISSTNPAVPLLTTIKDSVGRTLTFTRNTAAGLPVGLITAVTLTRPQGNLVWALNWGAGGTFTPETAFPGFTCCYGFNQTYQPSCAVTACSVGTSYQLNSVTIPDGRSYKFSYGDFGQLTQVTQPSGAAKVFAYSNGSDANSLAWQKARDNLYFESVSQNEHDNWFGSSAGIRRRILATQTDTVPNGPTTTRNYAYRVTAGTNGVGYCNQLLWEDVTFVEAGIVKSSASCISSLLTGTPNVEADAFRGRPIAEEIRSGSITGPLLQGTYWGNVSTGQHYYTYEIAGVAYGSPVVSSESPLGDIRATKVKHVRDGVTWWETFTYDTSNIPCEGTGCYRTWGNVTSHKIATDSAGAPGSTLVESAQQMTLGAYANFTAATVSAANVGTTTIGSGVVFTSPTVVCNNYVVSAAGAVSQVHVYVSSVGWSTGAQDNLSAAIYATDTSGNPTSKITAADLNGGQGVWGGTSAQWLSGSLPETWLSPGTYALCIGIGVNAAYPGSDHISAAQPLTLYRTSGSDRIHAGDFTNPFTVTSTGSDAWSAYMVVQSPVQHGGVNLVHLPSGDQTKDGSGTILTNTAYGYDGYALTASGESLDTIYPTTYRGNPTAVTRYVNAAAKTGPIATQHYYFDNGVGQHTVDANGHAASTVIAPYDFGPCSASKLTRTTTVNNALGQSITTVSDCYSGRVLSSTDLYTSTSVKAWTCSQYDRLGRIVEAAAPGDTLTPLGATYARDTVNCPANTGTAPGDNGVGPTAWTDYCSYGSSYNSPACGTLSGTAANRVISHARNGLTAGHVVTSFSDGLDREIEHCSQVDPTFSSNNAAICSTAVYDSLGRVSQSYVPFFMAAMPTSAAAAPSGDQYTQTTYDALGRAASTQLMKSGVGQLPATTTSHTSASGLFVTTVIDANLCQGQSKTDVLGRVVEHDVQNNATCGSTPTWLITTMQYDAAGRLGTVTDPAGNLTKLLYDGVSRKTQVSDPDRGTWKFAYDNNSNLTQQTDARNAVTNLHYDVLNRLTLRDLPYLKNGTTWVAGTAGEEDEFTYYDGTLPTTCYSCDDHCSTTTADTCNTATLACSHTGTACAAPNQ